MRGDYSDELDVTEFGIAIFEAVQERYDFKPNREELGNVVNHQNDFLIDGIFEDEFDELRDVVCGR